jgi:hypothetical protein
MRPEPFRAGASGCEGQHDSSGWEAPLEVQSPEKFGVPLARWSVRARRVRCWLNPTDPDFDAKQPKSAACTGLPRRRRRVPGTCSPRSTSEPDMYVLALIPQRARPSHRRRKFSSNQRRVKVRRSVHPPLREYCRINLEGSAE